MSKENKADSRYRNFATVIYPESANENWLEKLGELCVPVLVSPLHDSDVNADGEVKKEHHHILFLFEGKKSVNQVREIIDTFGGVGCEVVQSKRGYARYLCHLDNPEKHQYSPDEVIAFGGADYSYEVGTVLDKYKAIDEMIAFINEYEVVAYSDLLDYCRQERRDWFRVLCDNGTYVIKEYLKSETWKVEHNIRYSREALADKVNKA